VNAVSGIGSTVISVALVLPRIVSAFGVLPLLSQRDIPALVRNSFLVSLAVLVYPLAAAVPAAGFGSVGWPMIIVKELLIGLCLGFVFSAVFWAVSAAGNLIDTKVGSNFASILDPIQGHQTSFTGELLSQLAAVLFMASGAFALFIDLLMTSYIVWPVANMLPPLNAAAQELVIGEFESLLATALLLSAPALVVMSLLDLALGLVNRYAPQLNVFSLTMALKAWVATWIVLLSLGAFVAVIMHRLAENRDLLQQLHRVL
jgi:type III secretion protein T